MKLFVQAGYHPMKIKVPQFHLTAVLLSVSCAAAFAQTSTLYQNNFEGQSGYAADHGWQYSSTHGYRNWGAIGAGRNATNVLWGKGGWTHLLDAVPVVDRILSLSVEVDPSTNSSPRVGLFNSSYSDWDGSVAWGGHGPMIQYSPAGFLTLTRPIGAGGGSVTALVPNKPARAKFIMEIDTSTGVADVYFNDLARGSRLISGFDLKGNWSESQFRENIVNHRWFGVELGGGNAAIDNILVSSSPVRTLYTNHFETQSGLAADNGWQYSTTYGNRSWGIIGPGRNSTTAISGLSCWSQLMNADPAANTTLTLSADIDPYSNSSPRVGLLNADYNQWNGTSTWTGYGPMLQYSPDGELTLTRPTAAGGASISVLVPAAPQPARFILQIDAGTGFANVYLNAVNPDHLLIAGFSMLGNWTLAQFQSQIANYKWMGIELGSGNGEIDNIDVTSGPRLAPINAPLPLNPDSSSLTYGVASWPQNGLGNHRALVRVDSNANPVRVHIPWRRRDKNPELKEVLVYNCSTAQRVMNVVKVNVTREYGDFIFQADTTPADYAFYFLPYNQPAADAIWFATDQYLTPQNTADAAWLSRYHLTAAELATGDWKSLPQASVTAMQARTESDRFDPMEVIALASETSQLLAAYPGDNYLVFAEDRLHPVKMADDLPRRWIQSGPSTAFAGQAQPGEYYAFQLGVFAARQAISNVALTFGTLTGTGGKTIPASAFKCFNLGGTNYQGNAFTNTFDVANGKVRPMWIGVQVPADASGTYNGTITVQPVGGTPKTINVSLNVSGNVLADSGDSEPWRLSRLRWLDSSLGVDDGVVPPFTPIGVSGSNGSNLALLGRELTFNNLGFISSMKSNGREILNNAITFNVTRSNGNTVTWSSNSNSVTKQQPGVVERQSTATGGFLSPFSLTVNSKTECDGAITYSVALTANSAANLSNISLNIPMKLDVAKYNTGLGRYGSRAPESHQWLWDINKANNAVWLGDVDAGLHLKLLGDTDDWSNQLDLKERGIPSSWGNNGNGGINLTAQSNQYFVYAYTGARSMTAGQTLTFRFRLMVTPFKPVDTNHWNWRAGDDWPGDTIRHLHHGYPENLYINYPFLNTTELTALVTNQRNAGKGVNLYYNGGHLSVAAPELWALKSLGSEIFNPTETLVYYQGQSYVNGVGGGYSWLQEHLGTGYVAGWQTKLGSGETDATVSTYGSCRWNNYYVQGMDWLMRNTGVDGLFLDGIGYNREVMKRVKKVMHAANPNSRINHHGGNTYDYMGYNVSTASCYMEQFPYLDNIWYGEGFDYNKGPDYWLVEISGLPYGLTGEMMNSGTQPNSYRGMLYGMATRWPTTQPLYAFWDQFGIQSAQMIGYWSSSCPVTTGRSDVLATVYKKNGKTLIALASWAPNQVDVTLTIDWAALGINQSTATITAPAISNFQNAAQYAPGAAIPVSAGGGCLLIVQ